MPVSGIIQVGRQARADRYTYIPHMGLFTRGNWFAEFNLGVALFVSNRLEDSLAAFRNALGMDPTNAAALEGLRRLEGPAGCVYPEN